jgi:hypothetical protein
VAFSVGPDGSCSYDRLLRLFGTEFEHSATALCTIVCPLTASWAQIESREVV